MMINININLASNTLLAVQGALLITQYDGQKKLFRVVSVNHNKTKEGQSNAINHVNRLDR